MSVQVLIIAVCGAVAAMLMAVAVFMPKLNTEKRTNTRLQSIRGNGVDAKKREVKRDDGAKRRKNVQDTLKEIEEKNKSKQSKKPTLALKLKQAGLPISKTMFWALSVVAGLVCVVIGLIAQLPVGFIAAFGFVGVFGIPQFVISILSKRRTDAFINELPDAIDILVRGIKAGLPLMDGMRLVAAEAKEPLAGEFRNVIEAQQLGVPMGEAVNKVYENIPTPETSFFAIVISIQQSSGGSLAEALGNLGKVLRERKKMRMKVKAISSEAKASAGIIGSLPIFVGGAVFILSPEYIGRLFETSSGHLVLGIAAGMMGTGILVMRKMINFQI